jgi:cell division protein FtsI/penicillin-binding protein 2
MTPLQAANMIVTILNEGQLMAPRVVREIQFRSGVPKERFASQIIHTTNPERRRASRILRTWMRDTVTIGTAQSLDSAGEYLEGKTGTAQVFDQGQKKVNQWFVGAVANRFAIAVVVENVHPEAPQQALPLTQRLLGILQNYAKK